VAPTPDTQACADAGRSDRLVVDPRNTIRTVASVDGDPVGVGDAGVSSHAGDARAATMAIIRSEDRTRSAYATSTGSAGRAVDEHA